MRRTIIGVAFDGFGALERDRLNLVAIRDGMYQSLTLACARIGIDVAACPIENHDDGLVALVPPELRNEVLVDRLPSALIEALAIAG